jgi:hypothetical protein
MGAPQGRGREIRKKGQAGKGKADRSAGSTNFSQHGLYPDPHLRSHPTYPSYMWHSEVLLIPTASVLPRGLPSPSPRRVPRSTPRSLPARSSGGAGPPSHHDALLQQASGPYQLAMDGMVEVTPEALRFRMQLNKQVLGIITINNASAKG